VKWIKSIEQLPPQDRPFLGHTDDGIDIFFEADGPYYIVNSDGFYYDLNEITHWMELPEKPDEL